MKLADVNTVGVLGAGVMGGGISQTAILHGYDVVCRDLTDEILTWARDTIIDGRFGLKGGVERGKYSQEAMNAVLARLTLTTKAEDLRDCDLIIEAIGGGDSGQLEDKPLKLKVFKEMGELVKKEAVFASNTSGFTIADLAAVTNRKGRFIGMHLFSPANIMKLAEVIYTADTSEQTVQLIEDLARSWEKTPIRVKDVPGDTGFIGNRVFGAARREAARIVEEGIATEEDVDTAMMLGFNWPVGPFGEARGSRSGWK